MKSPKCDSVPGSSPDAPRPDSNELWGEYWGRAPADACTAELPPAVREAISVGWREAFAALDDGACVLDIATGKGAVLETGRRAIKPGRAANLTGLDRANPPPGRHGAVFQSGAAKFIGGADAARLPLPDLSQDLVTSQFGVEYAGLQAAAAEAARVCRGRILFLVHAADGAVVRQNSAQSEQIGWALDELGFTAALQKFFGARSTETAGQMDRILKAMRARAEREENPNLISGLIGNALELQTLADHTPLPEISRMIAAMETRMRDHAARMDALARAAPAADALEAEGRRLQTAGFGDLVISPLTGTSGEIAGRWISARRESGIGRK